MLIYYDTDTQSANFRVIPFVLKQDLNVWHKYQNTSRAVSQCPHPPTPLCILLHRHHKDPTGHIGFEWIVETPK